MKRGVGFCGMFYAMQPLLLRVSKGLVHVRRVLMKVVQ